PPRLERTERSGSRLRRWVGADARSRAAARPDHCDPSAFAIQTSGALAKARQSSTKTSATRGYQMSTTQRSRSFGRAPALHRAIQMALAGAAFVNAGSVFAQQAASAVEEIIVTGYRESLEQSLNIKRANTAAVDTILAEDIADFPDLNLAESIQRIPGVAIDRVGGEGRQITVRGLSPEFTRVRINGMEALTTTSATDAVGTNRGRGFDFNVFA